MTEAQALELMAYLADAFPQKPIGTGTIAVYAEALRSVPYERAMAAARHHVANHRFFPSVAELIAPIADEAVGLEEAEIAWLDVKRAISRWGRYRTWRFDNPATDLAVETIGKENLCNAEDGLVAERAHFFRVYAAYRERDITDARNALVAGVPFQSRLRERQNFALPHPNNPPSPSEKRELVEPAHIGTVLRGVFAKYEPKNDDDPEAS
jgi:hypothetical protein